MIFVNNCLMLRGSVINRVSLERMKRSL